MVHQPPVRRHSMRLATFDYTTETAYFVTICTRDRKCILDRDPIPAIVTRAWRLTTNGGRPPTEYQFVVMPNHIHGIVWSNHDSSLGDVIRSFKSFATRGINRLRGTPGATVWQEDYYDHIIRSDRALEAIQNYILDNPRKWEDDPNHPSKINAPGSRSSVGGAARAPSWNTRQSDSD